MRPTINILFVIFSLISPHMVIAETETTLQQVESTEIYQIGVMVKTLQKALTIRDEEALISIQLYGTDSRYYSMIRGWLFQELVSVESQLYASKSIKQREKFQRNSDFLKKAIRMIDLE